MDKEFRKFATRHMGINSMVLDDVVSMQNQYLNPYILEERQLNVTQMDVFSRLMISSSTVPTRAKTSASTSTALAEAFMQA